LTEQVAIDVRACFGMLKEEPCFNRKPIHKEIGRGNSNLKSAIHQPERGRNQVKRMTEKKMHCLRKKAQRKKKSGGGYRGQKLEVCDQ